MTSDAHLVAIDSISGHSATLGPTRRASPVGTRSATYHAMVRLSVAFSADSGRCAEDILEALRFLMTGTRLEPGCRGCSAWAEPDLTVHYLEEWETEADMRRRVRSPRFTSLLAVMESPQEPPKVQFDFVTSTRGLDYVAEIRAEIRR